MSVEVALPDAPVWRGELKSDYIAAPAPEWVDPALLRRAAKEGKRAQNLHGNPAAVSDKERFFRLEHHGVLTIRNCM
jgi:hypothetical protein